MSNEAILRALDLLRADLLAAAPSKKNVDNHGNSSSESDSDETPNCGDDTDYRLILVPPPHIIKPCKCECEKVTEQLQIKMAAMDEKMAILTAELELMKKVSTIEVDSAKIGRWVLETECDGSLVLRDTLSEGKRYKFPVGGNSDMYKDGLDGEIVSSRIVFPTRWSIGEESVSYLVFRDRGVSALGHRYAMTAATYRDL